MADLNWNNPEELEKQIQQIEEIAAKEGKIMPPIRQIIDLDRVNFYGERQYSPDKPTKLQQAIEACVTGDRGYAQRTSYGRKAIQSLPLFTGKKFNGVLYTISQKSNSEREITDSELNIFLGFMNLTDEIKKAYDRGEQ